MGAKLLDTIRGTIDRRILMNYRIDPSVLKGVLPEPFRPKLVQGYALGGVCLIRFKQLRPKGIPALIGMGSENAAHRIAVEWEQDGKAYEGVYIPRRNTSSWFNKNLGGKLFPAVFEQSEISADDAGDRLDVHIRSENGDTQIHFVGERTGAVTPGSVFQTVEEAWEFFNLGAIGYSATELEGRDHGVELRALNRHLEPLSIREIVSDYFDDRSRFPEGTIAVDSAFLMRNIEHEWIRHPELVQAGNPGAARLTSLE